MVMSSIHILANNSKISIASTLFLCHRVFLFCISSLLSRTRKFCSLYWETTFLGDCHFRIRHKIRMENSTSCLISYIVKVKINVFQNSSFRNHTVEEDEVVETYPHIIIEKLEDMKNVVFFRALWDHRMLTWLHSSV